MDFIAVIQNLLATQIADTFAALAKLLMPILVLLGLSSGCTITGQNAGSAWFEIATRFEVGHTNSKTADVPTTITVDGKALVNHIIDLRPQPELEPMADMP